MKEFYQQTVKEVLDRVESSETGLTSEQAGKFRERCGWNELAEGKKKSIPQIFLEQYKDFLVLILIASAIISGMLGDEESAAVILIVITINAILGTVQTIKAEQSLQSLKKLAGPQAKVLRDGSTIQLPARELVVGDVILVEAGDMIPADARLIENASLKVDESALTGESLAVEKSLEAILAGRSDQYALFRQLCDIWTRKGGSNGHRNADGGWKDCRTFEVNFRKADSVTGEPGRVWKEIIRFDPGILRDVICDQRISR